MKTRIIITSVALLAFASTAFAQSTVTGTLSSGASGSSTLSGTVGTSSGSTLTGTVTGGGGTTGGGTTGGCGGGGGSGSNIVDICPNIAGVQATLAGYVLQNGNCVLASGTTGGGTTGGGAVLGTSTETPGVPNTGAGYPIALLLLAGSAAAVAGSAGYLFRKRHFD